MRSNKYETLRKRVEDAEKVWPGHAARRQLIDDLVGPAQGGRRYRALLNRARALRKVRRVKPRYVEPPEDPMDGLRETGPRGLTRGRPWTGGNRTVSGGLPGTGRRR